MGGSAVQCAVLAGPLAPMRCACEGPGLAAARCGEPASFTIAAADAFGNRRGGADDFVVSVACLDTGGAAPVAARVEDLGRGSYRARTLPRPEHMLLTFSGVHRQDTACWLPTCMRRALNFGKCFQLRNQLSILRISSKPPFCACRPRTR